MTQKIPSQGSQAPRSAVFTDEPQGTIQESGSSRVLELCADTQLLVVGDRRVKEQ